MKPNLSIFFLILIIFGCEKIEQVVEIKDIAYLTNSEFLNSSICFSPSFNENEGFVINENEEYQYLMNSYRIHPINPEVDCDTASFIDVDFNEFSLIGVMTIYGTCDTIKRKVLYNSDNNQIIYEIEILKYQGVCNYMAVMNLNVALIPKMQEKDSVEFIITEI